MALLKLVFVIYIAVLAFGGLCAVFRFLADIKHFKDKEERFELFEEISKEENENDKKESLKGEVLENGN